MKIAPLILLASLLFLCGPAFGDQPVPFAPMGNVTGAYQIYQGNDFWDFNTNMPLSSQDVVYSETIWLAVIGIGIAFLFLAVVFVSFADSVPWIAMLICGCITWGTEFAAAYMTPYVGYTQVFHQVIATAASNGAIVLNATNTIYINEVVVYTQGQFAAYACWGLGIAGFIMVVAAPCFALGWLHARGISQAKKGDYIQTTDTEQTQSPDVVWRERESRRNK